MPIPAILLAAGASSRMGRPKALLPVDGRPAIDVIARALRAGGASPVVAVLGCHIAEIRAGAELRDVTVVEHAGWAAGRTSSIQAGIAALPADAEAVVLALVDMPFVRAKTVAVLLAAHAAASPDVEIIVPTHDSRRGHPILIRRAVFPRIAALLPDQPLSDVVRAARAAVIEVEDPGVLTDLDTPDDLRRARRR